MTIDEQIILKAFSSTASINCGMYQDFLDRKNEKIPIDYFIDEYKHILEPILKNTYGIIIFYEQIIEILNQLYGFSYEQAKRFCKMLEIQDILTIESYKVNVLDTRLDDLLELIIKFSKLGIFCYKSEIENKGNK